MTTRKLGAEHRSVKTLFDKLMRATLSLTTHRGSRYPSATRALPRTVNTVSAEPIEVWIAMNETGDYVVAKDEDEAVDLFNEECGGIGRMIRLKVMMSPPEVTEIDIEVPDDAGRSFNTAID
jgi:hypothetical protein